MTSYFRCECFDLDKVRYSLMQDKVQISGKWSKSKPKVGFQYGGRLFFSKTKVVISQPSIEICRRNLVCSLGLPDFLQQNTGDFCLSVTFVKDAISCVYMCFFVQVYSNYGRIFSHFGDVQRQRMA